jgi:hypothetical protein
VSRDHLRELRKQCLTQTMAEWCNRDFAIAAFKRPSGESSSTFDYDLVGRTSWRRWGYTANVQIMLGDVRSGHL